MLDKSVPYYEITMHRKKGTYFPEPYLPNGYSFKSFKPGDEIYWAQIETSVGEFKNTSDALEYFKKKYLVYLEELKRRCFFIENVKGMKISTCTVWWRYTGLRCDPWLDWISVRPECQGLGLGKAVVFEGMRRFIEIEGDRDIYLHTQTWSYKAINIYKKAGFYITDEKGLGGYKNDNYKKAIKILKKHAR